ncbi:MAG: hypothetical protein KIT84_30575 [Labilithrix sp.]|nr:hypothetical protein [Labilithrix sp.]MCW5815412.1 hypothetical protein [Labilithrix sp.]
MGKPPSVPDLDLPASGASSKRPAAPTAPARPAAPASGDDDDLFGGGIERGISAAAPVASNPHHQGKAVAIQFGAAEDDDPFGDAIERGAGTFSSPPASAPSRASASSRAPVPIASGPASLDLAYKPTNTARAAEEPDVSFLESAGARVVPLVGCIAVVAAALKFLHRPGRFAIGGLLPHALDASSTVQSGVFAGVALILAIGVGYYGFKTRPRSWAIVTAGALFLIASLAVVTVTLVSLEEAPSPADGGRLIPYVVPLAVLLFGLGVTSRGIEPFLDGGARRALSFGLGLLGGAIVYAGMALSAF